MWNVTNVFRMILFSIVWVFFPAAFRSACTDLREGHSQCTLSIRLRMCSRISLVVGSYIVSVHSFRQPPHDRRWEEPLFKVLPADPVELLPKNPVTLLKHLCRCRVFILQTESLACLDTSVTVVIGVKKAIGQEEYSMGRREWLRIDTKKPRNTL